MPAPKIITREKVEERIPFSFGLIQRVADDLDVTRTAISKFLNLPGNEDLKELLTGEKNRLRDYAEMTIAKRLLGGDVETAKWYLTAFPEESSAKTPKPYKTKKGEDNTYMLVSIDEQSRSYRELTFSSLDLADGNHPGTTNPLPYKIIPEVYLADEVPDTPPPDRLLKESKGTKSLQDKPKSGREIYEDFKKNWKG